MTLWPSRQLTQETTKCYLKGTSAWWEPVFLFRGKEENEFKISYETFFFSCEI